MRWVQVLVAACFPLFTTAQKKPLDHTVYDSWQRITYKAISRNGQWVARVVDPQEGDGQLILSRSDGSEARTFPRGYQPAFAPGNQYLAFRIKPLFADSRHARIRNKKADEMPRDSMGIINLATGGTHYFDAIRAFSFAGEGEGFLAVHKEKKRADNQSMYKDMDTTMKRLDSGKMKIQPVTEEMPDPNKKLKRTRGQKESDQYTTWHSDTEGDETTERLKEEGTDLFILDASGSLLLTLPRVLEYTWSRNGKILMAEQTPENKNQEKSRQIVIWRSRELRLDTISRFGNDFRSLTVDDAGYQAAFIAEKDSTAKSLLKTYKLWYWRNGSDSALAVAGPGDIGMMAGWSVSEHATLRFSKSGRRLFFGTAPIRAPRDTSTPEIDQVKLDIWHYNDDYLQTQQVKMLDRDLKKNYLAVYFPGSEKMVQLADLKIPDVIPGEFGDGPMFLGITDAGKRKEAQWEGSTRKNVFQLDPETATATPVKSNLQGVPRISPAGKYLYWYDARARQYESWDGGKLVNLTRGISYPLYNEEFDMPADPDPYGLGAWTKDEQKLIVYDRYDAWLTDPTGVEKPHNMTAGWGRKRNTRLRYAHLDPVNPWADTSQRMLFYAFHDSTKRSGIVALGPGKTRQPYTMLEGDYALRVLEKSRDAEIFIYTRESYTSSPNLYVNDNLKEERKLSELNPAQSAYNWGSAELFRWKAYDGRMSTGIVYKPENFQQGKRYPMVVYFYERFSDELHTYHPPAPTPSRLNISFFVSRGYIVFVPDIRYVKGYPGRSAYNYVVSGARAVVRRGWADSTHMGLQGQSWGGYQIAYLITRTRLFAAAWAGAPVANMTSAYGGIRWSTGLNRQFQYERSQSRIGASLWEKRDLYIENSPLFYLPSVETPLVIMANDNDGAVPWYQGIELFTGLRRLGKKVWMLNYNGEDHNLIERKNRKDIQIREQQFFDWLLKGEKPPRWLSDGVPATEKGRDLGLY